MNEVEPPPVWIGIITKPITKQMEVFPARDYQRDAYHAFMKGTKNAVLHVDDGKGTVFDIFPFDKPGYPRFCIFQNERKERSILSDSEEALKAYIKEDEEARKAKVLANQRTGYRATQARRLFNNYGGNRTKHSRKTKKSKRSKRAHTSKRK